MERIHVSVRARPLSFEDAKTSPWRINGNSISIAANQSSKFEFDQVFGEDCRTRDVYETRTRDIVAAAVRGFNGTVFAYGQTSSGKTHTMRGSNSEPGVIPLAVHDLFDIIHQDMDREFLLRMSYMEIYNEEINDLLAPEHRKLQIHESIERGIFVAGLRENIVASADQVLEYMEFGESHRHIGETNMNLYSSRSHTIFRMIIESREKTDDAEANMSCDAVRVSVLNLVDLAGSERASKTGAEGVRLKEGSHINKSLMTLGTVIKKLSEGVESQGGHVPYRDSKLTRILQPALGGNANTAIICNITLAQIHADETKSSLQFASRALRVTNCAHVNEILTDAALLKRQKKEIEELRAKLQGSHSDHLEDEILNLRNTLLKSELERERMALELEEEKRAQAEREKRLQEQAKRIENLSSMVFCSNREEICDVSKKMKRRDTWCPGNLARKKLKELASQVKDKSSDVNSTRADRTVGPLLPFDDLVKEEASKPDDDFQRNEAELQENNDLAEMQAEYEKLFMNYETQRTISDIQIDHLMRRLSEAELVVDEKCRDCITTNATSVSYQDGNSSLRELDAIVVIKQLQEKIAILEMEKSSSQQNLDCVFDLATEQTISAQEKYEKLSEELVLAREEATLAHEALASAQSRMEEPDWLNSLIKEAEEMKLEFENSRQIIGSISSVVDELLHFCPEMSNLLLDLRSSASQTSVKIKSIVRSHEKVQSFLRNKVHELQNEKLVLYGQASELRSRIEELNLEVQKSADAFNELNKEHESEKSEFLGEIQILQREISSLSSSSLVKEKESIRKDLDKTKSKLKDTEFKLKTAVQEKIKLEGEKSCAEREVKRLHGQQALLERNINKRESIVGRRHESTTDRSSNVFDQKRTKGFNASAELAMQEEYKKLEVLAFEMEATIAALEDQLAIANDEKDIATSRAEDLASDLQALSDELHMSHSELSTLKEEVLVLRANLEDQSLNERKFESSLQTLLEEKEELSMQLTEALLTMEEEKAIWSSKEKASIEVIEGAEKQRTAEFALLSKELSEARNELEICRKNCKDLEEWFSRSEENAILQKHCSEEKTSEINISIDEQGVSDDCKISPNILNTGQDSTCQNLNDQTETLRLELSELRKERIYLLDQVGKLEARESQVTQLKLEIQDQRAELMNLEIRMHNDQANNSKEKVILRMRLRGAQAKLDNYRVRYKELVDEMDFMNRKFEEASTKLKKQLAAYGTEILSLKRQIATSKGQ